MKQLTMIDIINVTGAKWTCTDTIEAQDTAAGAISGSLAPGVGTLAGAGVGFILGYFDAALSC